MESESKHPIKLDLEVVRSLIPEVEKIDYKTVSVENIASLIRPFFIGYQSSAPTFDPGLYIYRGRVCAKPTTIGKITYPLPEYVSENGRANSVGQPMFYGAVGKSIPFYELRAKVGDTIMVSIWRTTKTICLNHIGFTKEASLDLSSNRKLHDIYQFVKDTIEVGEANSLVYNYLGNIFSKKIDDSDFYKITIAIAAYLLNDPIVDGILYPTIAMAGNADNIVLKPSSVDNNLQFVSVEFVVVEEQKGFEYKFKTLDSANSIDKNGNILWTGGLFGYELKRDEKIQFQTVLGESVAKDMDDKRIDPNKVGKLYNNVSQLEKRFRKDFPDDAKLEFEVKVGSVDDEVLIPYSLNINFFTETKTISFYIPKTNLLQNEKIVLVIINNLQSFLDKEKDTLITLKTEGKLTTMTNDKIEFSNQVYFYSEYYINSDLIQKNISLDLNLSFIYPESTLEI